MGRIFVVRFLMKLLLAIFAFTLPASAMSTECGNPEAKKWNTEVPLSVATVTLSWTGVYEAPPAVCRVSYKTKTGAIKSLNVWGHPEPNISTSQIAFVSCADDGCRPDIVVADIAKGILLTTQLPINDPQFYLKSKWIESGRILRIEVERFKDEPAFLRYWQYYDCAVSNGIDCKQQESNPQLNRTREKPRAG